MPAFRKDEVREEVRQLILEVLKRKRKDVKPGDVVEGVSLLTQLGIDSLDILQLTATAEKKLGVKIPEEDIKRIDDLGTLLEIIEKNWPKGP